MSLAAGSLLLALLPWWIRIGVCKLRYWTELPDVRLRRNLYTAYGTSLFLQVAAMFLFWQSCIPVRGIQGTVEALLFFSLFFCLGGEGRGGLQAPLQGIPFCPGFLVVPDQKTTNTVYKVDCAHSNWL